MGGGVGGRGRRGGCWGGVGGGGGGGSEGLLPALAVDRRQPSTCASRQHAPAVNMRQPLLAVGRRYVPVGARRQEGGGGPLGRCRFNASSAPLIRRALPS